MPNQLQSVMAEQNRIVFDRLNNVKKEPSLSYSGANSFDCDAASISTTTNPNALQIPTISTNSNRC